MRDAKARVSIDAKEALENSGIAAMAIRKDEKGDDMVSLSRSMSLEDSMG